MNTTVCAIIVLYEPNIKVLKDMLKSLENQLDYFIIIDNTPGEDNLRYINLRCMFEYVPLYKNIGIAGAQNIGVELARNKKYEFVLFSDQDTIYPKDYINVMMKCWNDLKNCENICAIAPLFKDKNKLGENDGFIKSSYWGSKRFFPSKGIHEICQAISSGQIVKTEFFSIIGLFDERLFIDWVDLEWCWRARAKGFKLLGNANIIIQHSLGNNAKSIGTREINIRNPSRHYYITRNCIYLAINSKYIRSTERMVLLIKSFLYVLGFTFLSRGHAKNLRYTMVGLVDGIRGQLGGISLL
jgi:rhamnosyltransferase